MGQFSMLEVATTLLNTPTFSKSKAIHRIQRRRSINPNRNPPKQPLLQSLPKIRILKHRIRRRIRRLRSQHPILSIRRDRHIIRVIRIRRLHLAYDLLVPEQLADVRVRADREGAVGVVGCVLVDDHVVVGGAARVVAGEDCFEARDAVGGGGLDAAEEGGVDVGEVVGVAVARLHDAGVDACCVAVPGSIMLGSMFNKSSSLLEGKQTGRKNIPQVPPDVSQGLTGLDIQELRFKNDRYTCLAFLQIISNLFAFDPVWARLAAGTDDTSVGSSENGLIWSSWGVRTVGCVGLVQDSLSITSLHRSFVLLQCGSTASGCAGLEVGKFAVTSSEASSCVGVEGAFCDEF